MASWADTSKGGTDAALWTGKKATDLGALGPLAGSYSIAYGINDSGQVAGFWAATPSAVNSGSRPFLYSNGAITSLPEPGNLAGASCQARAINNAGQIAGLCVDSSGSAHLVLWHDGTASDLGTVGNIGTMQNLEALAVNSNGQIAGWTANAGGFLYSNGTITHPSGFSPAAINDNGVLVGGSSIDSAGTVQDLNSLIPAGSGYQITYATGINDNGQIIAQASGPASSDAAVLLNPS